MTYYASDELCPDCHAYVTYTDEGKYCCDCPEPCPCGCGDIPIRCVYSDKKLDTIKIDYHLSHYNASANALVKGIDEPKEFARIDAIRKASLVAIALEIGVINAIGDADLSRDEWERTISWMSDYENQELAA
jgi:hypothetical protein